MIRRARTKATPIWSTSCVKESLIPNPSPSGSREYEAIAQDPIEDSPAWAIWNWPTSIRFDRIFDTL